MSELRELLRELWSARRRLLPVMLGLCLGTLGLAVLVAFGDGFDRAMRTTLSRSGDSMLRWYGGATMRPFAGQPAGRSIVLTEREAEVLRTAPGVAAVAAEASLSVRVLADDGERSANVTVAAVWPEWAEVRGRTVAAGGRFLSAIDAQQRRRVAVVGAALARRLFGTAAVVGRSVRAFGQPFTIVGVLPEQPLLMNYNGDDAEKIIVPLATAQALRGIRQVTYVLARIDDPELGRRREAEQRALLAGPLRCDPADRAAIRLTNHAVTAGEIRAVVAGTRWFLIVIGVLGLLVAAVGVANMTFVLVQERVPEIGLRMALGATPRQIRRRQLLETAAVVAAGGGAGMALAAVLLRLVAELPLDATARGYLGDPLLSPAMALVVALLLGACAGIAGWQPAARAAAVQPVEALRHE